MTAYSSSLSALLRAAADEIDKTPTPPDLSKRLPYRKYPLEAERQLIPIKWAQYHDPVRYGVLLNDEGKRFNEAVKLGYVEDTPVGLEILSTWFGMGRVSNVGTLTEFGIS